MGSEVDANHTEYVDLVQVFERVRARYLQKLSMLPGRADLKLLPCHPHIRDDEALISWFLNIAASNGVSASELGNWLDIQNFVEVIGKPNSRIDQVHKYLGILSKTTGVPLERIRESMISEVHGLFCDRSLMDCPPYRELYPWVTEHVGQVQRLWTGEFCSQCLRESAYFKLSWRISLFVSCLKHSCLLSDRCGACGRHFAGFWHLVKTTLDLQGELLLTCPYCRVHITSQVPIIPVNPVIAQLEAVHANLIRNENCRAYFLVLHWVLGIIAREKDNETSRRFRKFIERAPQQWDFLPRRFELCTPFERQHLLLAAIDLFRNWPEVFLDAVRHSRLRLPHTIVRDLPEWFTGVFNLARKQYYSIESIRDVFWSSATQEGWQSAAEFLTGSCRREREAA